MTQATVSETILSFFFYHSQNRLMSWSIIDT